MKQLVALLLLVVLLVAACGGGKDTTTKTAANTAPRNVVKPLERPLVVPLQGKVRGTARVRHVDNKQTSVALQLGAAPVKALTAELDKGSCGAPKGLQMTKPLGKVTERTQSWSVVASLTQLTSSPLAFVLRSRGKVVACGNVPQA
jgi:hypothetical protein